MGHKYIIELLSDCYLIVDEVQMGKIKEVIVASVKNDQVKIIEGHDHMGASFGIRTDSIIVWSNDEDRIRDVLTASAE